MIPFFLPVFAEQAVGYRQVWNFVVSCVLFSAVFLKSGDHRKTLRGKENVDFYGSINLFWLLQRVGFNYDLVWLSNANKSTRNSLDKKYVEKTTFSSVALIRRVQKNQTLIFEVKHGGYLKKKMSHNFWRLDVCIIIGSIIDILFNITTIYLNLGSLNQDKHLRYLPNCMVHFF